VTEQGTTTGERLRTVRRGLGLEQQDVAIVFGVDTSVISRHERDKRGLAEETALRYAKYYGVDVDFLLCRDVLPKTETVTLPQATTRGARLRELRVARGYKRIAPCARMIGVNVVTMTQHELDLRDISRQRAEVYAAFFRVPAGYILFGEALPAQNLVDIVGTIAAGGRVDDMPPQGSEIKQITVPAAQGHDLAAYVVTGDDLYPALFHGDVVLCSKPNGHIDALEINNRECIVTTASGEKLIRVVKAESEGRFSLFGPHGPPQFNVRLRSAAPVIQINRGQLRTSPRP
jgi:transcriptional regulator with XRE-family HTH domain